MWEPNMTGAKSSRPPRTPTMLPMASTVTVRPRSRIQRTSRSRPARSSSLSASRQLPPPGKAPMRLNASSRPSRRSRSIRGDVVIPYALAPIISSAAYRTWGGRRRECRRPRSQATGGMTELITIGNGRARCAGPAIEGTRGRSCTVLRSVASGGLESHRDPGGPLRRRGQRGDESFGCFAIVACGRDASGIGGGICYGCLQRPHDFDAFRRHDLAHEGRANLRIAGGYLFHHLVAVVAKECFAADRGGDAEPFEQASEKNPRRAARLRVRVSDRTGLEHCLLEAFRRRNVRYRRGGVHADAGQGAAELGPAARDECACSLHLRNHRRRAHDDIRGLSVLEPLLHAADRREAELDLVARIARELRSDVGDDVFNRSGGQDFQMRGGTGNGCGWRHHPPSLTAGGVRDGRLSFRMATCVPLSKSRPTGQANAAILRRDEPGRTSSPRRDAAPRWNGEPAMPRSSIYVGEIAHQSPIPNTSRMCNNIVSGLIRGADPA